MRSFFKGILFCCRTSSAPLFVSFWQINIEFTFGEDRLPFHRYHGCINWSICGQKTPLYIHIYTLHIYIYKNTWRWKVIFLLIWWNNWRSFHIECELFLKLREMVEIEIGLFWLDRLTNWRKHKEIVEFLRNQEKGRRGLLKSKHF